MTKYEMVKRLVEIFDTFLIHNGDNVDPRANSNSTRMMLYAFYSAVVAVGRSGTSDDFWVKKMIEDILENGWTTHNFDGSEGFEQVPKDFFDCPPKYRVYDSMGQLVRDA